MRKTEKGNAGCVGEKKTTKKWPIDELLQNLENRMANRYAQVDIESDRCYLLPNGVVFKFYRPLGFLSLVIEYADNLEDAERSLFEDGDPFPLVWGEERIFAAMVREIEEEAGDS
ncbi:MAG: hypothetical protein QM270_03880 [Bacillota bacterium]|nr:hypothetical protein [Bacillota bacterium]